MKHAIQNYVQKIHQARLEKGWSQIELAQKAGITQSHLSRIERGEIDLRLSNVIQLARLVDLELMFVPRNTIPAIKVLSQQLSGDPKGSLKKAYTLDEEDET